MSYLAVMLNLVLFTGHVSAGITAKIISLEPARAWGEISTHGIFALGPPLGQNRPSLDVLSRRNAQSSIIYGPRISWYHRENYLSRASTSVGGNFYPWYLYLLPTYWLLNISSPTGYHRPRYLLQVHLEGVGFSVSTFL